MSRRQTAAKSGGQRVRAPKLLEDVETRRVRASRQVPRKDLDGRQAREAAARLMAFIDAHPEERAWLADWGDIDLAAPPASLSD